MGALPEVPIIILDTVIDRSICFQEKERRVTLFLAVGVFLFGVPALLVR